MFKYLEYLNSFNLSVVLPPYSITNNLLLTFSWVLSDERKTLAACLAILFFSTYFIIIILPTPKVADVVSHPSKASMNVNKFHKPVKHFASSLVLIIKILSLRFQSSACYQLQDWKTLQQP